jgi:energy-coupling factor transporter ATP-binding protein EcfA2
VAESDLLGFKDLLYARDSTEATGLEGIDDVSQLADDEAHGLATTLVAESVLGPDAESTPEMALRRSLLLAVCFARGLLDPDIEAQIKGNPGDVDLDELAQWVIRDQDTMWEGLRAEESQLLRAGHVAPPSPEAPPQPLAWFLRLVQWLREMFSPSRVPAQRDEEAAVDKTGTTPTSSSSAATPDVLRLVATLEQSLLEQAVLPALRRGVTAQLGELRSTILPVRQATGLGQLASLVSQVDTEGRQRLARLASSLSTGAIGVAGPRGAGKTTLLTALERGVIPSGDPPTFRYRCLTSAPTRYDAREFLLHLTQELCDAVLEALAPESKRQAAIDDSPRWRLAAGWLPMIISLGLVIAGVGLVTNNFIDWGVATGAMLVTAAMAVGASSVVWSSAYRLVAAFAALALAVAGIAVVGTQLLVPGLERALIWGAGAIYAACVTVGVMFLWPSYIVTRAPMSKGDEVAWRRAQELYDSTRYQMSFSSSVNASVSFDFKPVGASVGRTMGVTRNALPESLPDVVKNFCSFVAAISTESTRTLIIVDELDKMATPQDTAAFLNDIKGVFGLNNSIFVLSVSEDALASFERRGLQARDEIDSSFDDVVRIEPLSLAASTDLLDQRVPRVPTPFWALCYALTGGLARDLIRAARSLFDLAGGSTLELSAASKALVRADVRARALGTLAILGAQTEARPDLATWALRMSNAEVGELRVRVLALPPPQGRTDKPNTTVGDDQAARLCCQAYLGATVVEVFADRPFAEFEAALDAESKRYLGQFGEARRLLPLSINAAWLAIDESRVAWGLDRWPAPGSAPQDPVAG